jgi:hypothetical protein
MAKVILSLSTQKPHPTVEAQVVPTVLGPGPVHLPSSSRPPPALRSTRVGSVFLNFLRKLSHLHLRRATGITHSNITPPASSSVPSSSVWNRFSLTTLQSYVRLVSSPLLALFIPKLTTSQLSHHASPTSCKTLVVQAITYFSYSYKVLP